jgi:hypothetical protein
MINNSRNDLAIQLVSPEVALFATYTPGGEIEVIRLQIDPQLAQKLREWRQLHGASVDINTEFRFLPLFSTENTRVVPLDEAILSMQDEDLVLWLVESEKIDRADAAGNPIFDAPFFKDGKVNAVYDFTRLKNGEVTLTEIPYRILEASRKTVFGMTLFDATEMKQLANLPQSMIPAIPHHVDTRLRSLLRYAIFKNDFLAGEIDNSERVFIVLGMEAAGCSFAVWSPKLGIISEVGEVFHQEDSLAAPDGMTAEEYRFLMFRDHLDQFISSQLDEYLVTSPEMQVEAILYAQSENIPWRVTEILETYTSAKEIKLRPLDDRLSLEEICVRGLLLASDEDAAEEVPPVNLALDLKNRADNVYRAQNNAEAEQFLVRKRATTLAFFAPIAVTLAILIGWFFTTWQNAISLSFREGKAQAEEARLKPILESRKSYEKILDWYQDLLRQMIDLRSKQTLAFGFATRLNYMYPQTDDSFYLSQLVVKPGGAFEIHGLTVNQDSVVSLVRMLESATDENSKKLFDGLQIDYKQGSDVEVKGGSSGSGGGGNTPGNLSPGINAFSVKGSYLPMAMIKVANSSKTKPAPAASPEAKSGSDANPAGSSPASKPTVEGSE